MNIQVSVSVRRQGNYQGTVFLSPAGPSFGATFITANGFREKTVYSDTPAAALYDLAATELARPYTTEIERLLGRLPAN